MSARPQIELPSDRPVLLLDIDGVINVYQCRTAREARIVPDLPALKLLPGVEEWLGRLNRTFYLIWCSPPQALRYLDAAGWGLEPRPAIEPTADEVGQTDWKVRAVPRALAGWSGALAWVEDGFPAETRAWAAQRLARGARTWLVDVSEMGLTAEVTGDLIRWGSE